MNEDNGFADPRVESERLRVLMLGGPLAGEYLTLPPHMRYTPYRVPVLEKDFKALVQSGEDSMAIATAINLGYIEYVFKDIGFAKHAIQVMILKHWTESDAMFDMGRRFKNAFNAGVL
jgi:hypothetical protein